MEPKISRRKFLKTSVITAAAVGVTLCGAGTFAAVYQPKVDLPSTSYGENKKDGRILLAYASKAGSTAEVAVHIGEIPSQKGLAVDVTPVSKVSDLSLYQAVILGSAIRAGNLLSEAMQFVEQNQAVLQQKPFNAFILCTTLEKDNEETRKTVGDYLNPLRALAKPVSEGLFAGVMDLSKLKLYERLIIKAMKAPIGDFRQWDKIDAWAENVSDSLG